MKTGIYWQNPKYALRPGRDFIFDPSLVLYLPLHHLDGASFMSKEAYGHLATVTGALWTPRGRDFDGVDDYINCGHPLSLNFTSEDFSIEAWIKPDSLTSNPNIFAKGSAVTEGYFFRLLSDGSGYLCTNQSGAWQLSYFPFGCITTGVWQYVACSRSGAVVKIYKDGIDVTTNPGTHLDPVSAPTRDAVIGIHPDKVQTELFDGLIGEVRIYNRALTPLGIQHNYLATKWRYQ